MYKNKLSTFKYTANWFCVCVCVYRQICTIAKQICSRSKEKETAKERSSQIEHQISVNIRTECDICACNIKEVQCILLLVYHFYV